MLCFRAWKEIFDEHRKYARRMTVLSRKYKVPIRHHGLPETLSERLIRLMIHHVLHDATCTPKGRGAGDLFSETYGVVECKSFTSLGPVSFSPKSRWNELFVLDATQWMTEYFVLYRVRLSSHSEVWQGIMINRTQTFADQCAQRRRPRLLWRNLYPQIQTYCDVVFSGHLTNFFEGVYTRRRRLPRQCKTRKEGSSSLMI